MVHILYQLLRADPDSDSDSDTDSDLDLALDGAAVCWSSTVPLSATTGRGDRRCPRASAAYARTHAPQRNVTHGRALVVINTFAERPPSVRPPVDMNIRPPIAPYVRSLTRARVCVRARFGVSCAVRLEWAGGGW